MSSVGGDCLGANDLDGGRIGMTDQYGLVLEHVWPILLAVMLLVWAGAIAMWLENRGF